jgi:hypothetical protein
MKPSPSVAAAYNALLDARKTQLLQLPNSL